MARFLQRVGLFAAGRYRVVMAAWAALVAVVAGAFALGSGGLTNSFDIPGTASGEVLERLEEGLPGFAGASGQVVFHREDGQALDAEQQAQVAAVSESARDLDGVEDVVDPFTAQAQLEEQQAQIEGGRQQLDAGAEQLAQAQIAAREAQEELDAALQAAGEQPPAALLAEQEELDAQLAQLTAGEEQLGEQRAQLEAGAELAGLAEGIGVVSDDGATAIANVSFTEPRLELDPETTRAVMDHFTADPIAGVDVEFSTDISQEVPQVLGSARWWAWPSRPSFS